MLDERRQLPVASGMKSLLLSSSSSFGRKSFGAKGGLPLSGPHRLQAVVADAAVLAVAVGVHVVAVVAEQGLVVEEEGERLLGHGAKRQPGVVFGHALELKIQLV